MIKGLSLFALGLSLFTIQAAQAIVPTAAVTFGTDVEILNATTSQTTKIRDAEIDIRDVVATEEFRSAIINHTYGGKKTFVDNGGLTNTQIYNKILAGVEKLNGDNDNEMDLGIKTYYENSNTVGWTSTGSRYINMNTKFLNIYNSNQVARNMTHEWLHKLGFSHAVNYSYSRDFSVPYAVGKIMERLAAKY